MRGIAILGTLLLSTSLFAENCTYSIKASDLNLSWKAFKTPLKIGVGGKFNQLGVKDQSASSLRDLVEGIKFDIDTNSTDTGNPDRDKKIVKFFFQNMDESSNITGETLILKKKVLTVRIKMNKFERDIPLNFTKTDNSFEAKGVIDVFDFGLNKSLAGINKACEALHEGKTWSDVEVVLSAKYSKSCK